MKRSAFLKSDLGGWQLACSSPRSLVGGGWRLLRMQVAAAIVGWLNRGAASAASLQQKCLTERSAVAEPAVIVVRYAPFRSNQLLTASFERQQLHKRSVRRFG